MTPAGETSIEQPLPAAAPSIRTAGETDRRIPVSTYRLQFHAGFTFADATALIPYLHALGITDCYCSSYLHAVAGSLHGYDVVDPTSLNPEVGTEDDFRRFVEALQAHGMGQVLDVVPNHMGIAGSANRWWQDVLENGPSSRYAKVFDIDWQPLKPELAHKVLLPILGDQYGTVLERGEIRLVYHEGAFCLHYFETTLPAAPRSYVRILRHRVDMLTRELGEEHPDLIELLSIITSLERLPTRDEQDPDRLAERQREKEVAKRRLGELVRRSGAVETFIIENVRQIQRAARRTVAASTCSTRCWATRRIASPTGAWRRRRSTIAASSTSTSWPPSGWTTRTSSRKRIASCSGCCTSAPSRACGSITWTGCTIRVTTCAACRRARASWERAAAIGRSSSWSRRSSRPTNRCRRAGRWTGPRDTSSQTR